MLSAVKRYRALVAGVLQRCFPRTSAHLREEDELLFRRWGSAPGKTNKAAAAKRKGKSASQRPKPKSKSEGPLALPASRAGGSAGDLRSGTTEGG